MIKIETARPSHSGTSTKKKKSASSGTGFASLMDSLSTQNEAALENNSVSDTAATNSLDMILSTQAIPEEITHRQRNIRQANLTLDSLEALRNALLMDAVPLYLLHDIERRMIDMRETETDPLLIDIIEDIELRAAVEVAKFKMQR